MAQQSDETDLKPDMTEGYKPPAEKSLKDIISADAEDESLKKYKETLLGQGPVEVFPNDKRRVIVTKLGLVVEGRPEVQLDLTGDLGELKKKSYILKESVQYRIRIYFYVQREIVQGLKYVQASYRAGIKVDKNTFMVGSYGPKKDLQSFTTPPDEAPSGMVARGSYTIKSLFTDDDGNEHLKWEWKLEIKKDWD